MGAETYPDWISAMSDIIMAFCAVLGIRYASKWYYQVINDEGTKIALEFLEKILPGANNNLFFTFKVSSFPDLAAACFNGSYKSHKEIFDSFFDDFLKGKEKLKINISTVVDTVAALERRGISVRKDKKKYLDNFVTEIHEISALSDEIYDLLSLIRIKSGFNTSIGDAMRFNKFSEQNLDNNRLSTLLYERCLDMAQSRQMCSSHYLAFTEGDAHIRTYFGLD